MLLNVISSIQNLNSVFNYSPSYNFKTIRPSFIFRTQINIFFIKSESFLTLHWQQRNLHIQGPEQYKDIKVIHVTPVV